MSVRGEDHTLLAAGTPAITATATAAFRAYGNSLDIFVTTVSGGAGTLTLALKSSHDASTYFTCYDGDSAWAHTVNVNTAGTYNIPLQYSFIPNQSYILYYSCTNAAGTIAIKALSWENPAGSMSFTGDVIADLDVVNTNTTAIAAAVGTDGSTGPTKAMSIAGTIVATGALQECNVDTDGNLQVDVLTLPVGTAAMTASTPVTIATDDTMFTALDTAVDIIAGDTTSLDAKFPDLGTAAMAASTPVTISTDDVVSTATGIHDVAAAAKLGGMRLLGNATSALQTAVSAANDDAKINTDLSGQVRLASHTIATTSDRGEEIDPLSAQYDAISLISNEAVVLDPGASYAPSSAGQAWGGYGPLSIGLDILGGVGAASADRTVTVTIEATNGQTVAAAVVWVDITESVKSLLTGLDSAESFTSTGATAYSDILTLRREDSNFTHFRVKYDWDGDPSVTPGRIVALARGAAL